MKFLIVTHKTDANFSIMLVSDEKLDFTSFLFYRKLRVESDEQHIQGILCSIAILTFTFFGRCICSFVARVLFEAKNKHNLIRIDNGGVLMDLSECQLSRSHLFT